MTTPFSPTSVPVVAPNSDTTLRDGRNDFNAVFIHSRLDDYGLTPPQFRVYAHLSRRAGSGQAWPAVATIARVCKLHPQTVRQALKFLGNQQMITRDPRPGTTPIYRLTPPSQWLRPPQISANPSDTDTPASVSEATLTKSIEAHPYETDVAKGNPVECNPLKVIQVPHSPPKGERVSEKSSRLNQAEEIYRVYPKQIAWRASVRAIINAIRRHGYEMVLTRTRLYAQTYTGPINFIPNPATFFNQDRFMDDPATWQRIASPVTKSGFVPPREFDSSNYQQPVENF